MLAITCSWLLLAPALANAATVLKTVEFKADEGGQLENQNVNGTFQGDEVLDNEQTEFEEGKSDVDRTWIQDPRYRWPGGVVPYAYGGFFSTDEKKMITDALA